MFSQVFVNLGKSEKQRKLWLIFLKKSKRLKKKRKKKKFITSLPHYFLKICKGFVKGFAPWILFDCFEEKFLYLLECREVPSGS